MKISTEVESESNLDMNANEDRVLSMRIYPNPASDKINISINNPMSGKISVKNSLGVDLIVKSIGMTKSQIELAVHGLMSGLYLVTLTDSNTGESFTSQLVIE